MRRSWRWTLFLAVLIGLPIALFAQERGSDDVEPSLEYRPSRPSLPEPKPTTQTQPLVIFKETIGAFGIGEGSFDTPVDVAHDAVGSYYVLDSKNNRVQKFDSFNNFALAWGSYGTRSGEFNRPQAIAVDSSRPDFDYVFVVDTGNSRVQVFSFDRRSGQVAFLDSWGSPGSRDGDFRDPRDLIVDGSGHVWVVDAGNERIQKFRFDPTKTLGSTATLVGGWGRSFGGRGGAFAGLAAIGWSKERFGFAYLLSAGCLVQQFKLDGTLEKSWSAVAPESGPCVPARIRVDDDNDWVYVLDAGNGLLMRFSLDGKYLTALRGAVRPFSRPLGFSLNPARDEVLVADTENNSVQKFTLR